MTNIHEMNIRVWYGNHTVPGRIQMKWRIQYYVTAYCRDAIDKRDFLFKFFANKIVRIILKLLKKDSNRLCIYYQQKNSKPFYQHVVSAN